MSPGYDNPQPGTDDVPQSSLRGRRGGVLRARTFWLGGLLGGAAVLALGVKFPQEILQLRENQAEIRRLQEENANLRKRRDERLQRLKDLRENSDLLNLEIEKSLKLYPKDHKVFILPPKGTEETAKPETNSK